MIRGVLLSLLAWAVSSALGWPIDAFLPLVVALGLRDAWPLWARVVVAVALAPLAAGATGDLVTHRVILYGLAIGVSANMSGLVDDRVAIRVAFTAAALVGTVMVCGSLAWADLTPAIAWRPAGLALTLLWATVHAALSSDLAPTAMTPPSPATA